MSARTPRSSCASSNDDQFGPQVQGCRGDADFTLLFEQSILSIAPATLFLCLFISRIAWLWREDRKTKGHYLRYTKLVVSVLLFSLQVALLALWAEAKGPTVRTAVPAAVLLVLDTLVIVILSFLEHSRSTRTSDYLVVYLLCSILCDATQLRTLWLLHRYVELAAVASSCVVLKVLLLFLEAWGKDFILLDKYKSLAPEALSGIFNRRLFWWLNPLFLKGLSSNLGQEDMYQMDEALCSTILGRKLGKAWASESCLHKHSLIWTTLHTLRGPLIAAAPPRTFLIGLKYAQPFLINRIISSVGTAKNTPRAHGLIGATGLLYIAIAITTGYYQHKSFRFITMVRGSLVAVLFDKTTEIATEQTPQRAPVTLMSTDVDAIAAAFQGLHDVWAAPIEVSIGIWLLERQVGVACTVSVGIALVCVILMTRLAKLTGPRQGAWNKAVQERVAVTSSILGAVKNVKMAGLSTLMASKIQMLRKSELELSKKFRVLTVLINLVGNFPLLVSPIVTFSVYFVTVPIPMTMSQAFTTLTLITLICSSLYTFTGSLPQLTASFGCFDRIQDFLALADSGLPTDKALMVKDSPANTTGPESSGYKECIRTSPLNNFVMPDASHMLEFHQVSIAKPEGYALVEVDLKVSPGQIVAITGPIASGKSVLLRACAGELRASQGYVYRATESVGYCAQVPWLRNASIRDNIVESTDFDQLWYSAVITVCTLDKDLESMKDGDLTLVGTGGLVLSGGQRQRIALARAVYSRNRILILDDPFSGLDQQTSNEVYSRLFGDGGLLASGSTTVLFSTHDYTHLPAADWVVILSKEGRISQQGHFADLELQGDRVQWLKTHLNLTANVTGPKVLSNAEFPANQKMLNDVNDLTRRTGDFGIYYYYAQSIGWPSCLIFLSLSIVYVFLTVFPQVWLRFLVEAQLVSHRVSLYFGIYGLLAFLGLLSVGYMFLHVVPKSGQHLHRTLADYTLNASLSYFNSTDLGNILNRFSQDMSLVDMALPAALFRFVVSVLNCVATIVLVSTGAAYVAAATPILFVLLYALQSYYLATSRQLRLLDLEAKSPLFTHFSETLEGLATIRAFGWQDAFKERALRYLDASQRPSYLLYCVQRWLNVVMNLIVAAIAVMLVAFALQLDISSAGAVGVGLVSLLGLNENLALLILSWTSLEISLGAVARVRDFEMQTPQERTGPPSPPSTADLDWPRAGRLELRDVCATYGDSTQLCLRNISLTLPSGGKLAIIGRTGSGKSSLFQAIFGLLELKSGHILIDGVAISDLPLQFLRSRITAVPQELLILHGAVRYNLDPRGCFSDEEIISSLQKVGIWDCLPTETGLDIDMNAAGLSHGQNQLLSLARALLQQSRIVFLDEATSSVDNETEDRMMQIISQDLKDATIVAVTHRLRHIRSFDIILVLEEGGVAMIGTPDEVMASHNETVKKLHDHAQ
ncbi:ABC transporter-like protein [Stipitochalara longipes BDJ]|nr:ABC transporter-like protein [Stipitochalara longipes BDJ]